MRSNPYEHRWHSKLTVRNRSSNYDCHLPASAANFSEWVTYSTTVRGFQGQTISLTVTYNGRQVAEPQHFLNEARLTAMALSLYLAAARIIRSGRPGIMVLDDVLIGLDLWNRIPLLHLLRDLSCDARFHSSTGEYRVHARRGFRRNHLLAVNGACAGLIPRARNISLLRRVRSVVSCFCWRLSLA